MSEPIVHLNGRLVPRSAARVDPFDRGFLFGDGLYEGLRAFGGRVFAASEHAERMSEGLARIGIDWDAGRVEALTGDLLEANALRDAFVYWQITRGSPAPSAPLRERVPSTPMEPTAFAYCGPLPGVDRLASPAVKRVRLMEDPRWRLGRIKSISLMGNVVAALDAAGLDADDALMTRGGLVSESTTANVIVVGRKAGRTELATPDLDSTPILAGVTRRKLLEWGLGIVERPIHVEELLSADEVMLVGTVTMITAVTAIDGRAIGDGTAGPETRRMFEHLVAGVRRELTL